MAKDISYYKSKLTALRNAMTELLEEMDKDKPASTPSRKRQNKKEGRVLNFDAFYNRKKIK